MCNFYYLIIFFHLKNQYNILRVLDYMYSSKKLSKTFYQKIEIGTTSPMEV